MSSHREDRGRFVVDANGVVVPVSSLELPEGVTRAPAQAEIVTDPVPAMGPTRVGEWLMVDVRVAKLIAPGTRLFKICKDLSDRGYCGIVESTSTLVIDLLQVGALDDRRFLMDRANWPVPKA